MNDLWIILTAALVAAACSLVGCFLVLRKMAMIGDAISHSVLPGIVIAFLISGSRGSIFMLIGAAVIGLITVFLIQLFQQSGVQSDASIGVVFTAMFSIGVVLVSLYTRQIDLDLDCVLYGEIAYVPWNIIEVGGVSIGPKAIWAVGFALLLSSVVIGLFYKQFKLCSFDPALAAAVGIPVLLFHYLLMGLVSITTVASFESVGAILVVGMLIVPAATAYLLTEKLSVMLVLSVAVGVVSSIAGYFVAYLLDASIAGCMISVAGVMFVFAFLMSPTNGLIIRKIRQKRGLSGVIPESV
ncbi:metal ABC transporter permease [Paenibacillus alginolyticus]|uniref:Metal ABC transporter permease n=1 Tax=Paenibacillus alginolyticus TaxID=59839 RepID=A0ABT4GHF8_9BACL|nr:metal ABC transporter permease [Paenibacillus alginolyticus]MCY9665454.1 metal ABC transporter permease [Paenibacillus alginolyticus]MCY9695644.1 metal ABC transporter permease [Paenibacillus alginolyticus]MEC0147436.1 metal ABC transporter permease [Paenibacillus alginolyticus]